MARRPSTQDVAYTEHPHIKTPIERVSENISSVVTVAGAVENGTLDTVLTHVPTLETVSGSIANVIKVADIAHAVDTLAMDLENIDLVATELAVIGNCSKNMATLLLLRQRMVDLLAIKDSLTNIDAVALNEDNINSVFEAIPEMATICSHMRDIHWLGENADKLGPLLQNLDAILQLCLIEGDITTVANNISVIVASAQYVEEIGALAERILEAERNVVALEDQVEQYASQVSANTAASEASKQAARTFALASQTSAESSLESAEASVLNAGVAESAKETTVRLKQDCTDIKNELVRLQTTTESNVSDLVDQAVTAKNTAEQHANTAGATKDDILDIKEVVDTSAEEIAQNVITVSGDVEVVQGLAEAAAESAKRAENAAASLSGAMVEAGSCDLSSGIYPDPIVDANGQPRSCFWKVVVGGTIDDETYGVGDSLVYSVEMAGYYKISNSESVTSVAGLQGVISTVELKTAIALDKVPNHTLSDVYSSIGSTPNFASRKAVADSHTALSQSKLDKTAQAADTALLEGDTKAEVISSARQGLASALALTDHTTDTTNPHGVTKTQIGLSKVPNYAASDSVNSNAAAFATSKAVKTVNDITVTKVDSSDNPTTGAIVVPTGSEAEKPDISAEARGLLRYTTGIGFEGFDPATQTWGSIGGGSVSKFEVIAENLTAAVSKGYWVETAKGSFAVTLPDTTDSAQVKDGASISIGDVDGSAKDNPIAVTPKDGFTVMGLAESFNINTPHAVYTFVLTDTDWRVVNAVGETASPDFIQHDSVYESVKGQSVFAPDNPYKAVIGQCDVYYNDGRLVAGHGYQVLQNGSIELTKPVTSDKDLITVRTYNRSDVVPLQAALKPLVDAMSAEVEPIGTVKPWISDHGIPAGWHHLGAQDAAEAKDRRLYKYAEYPEFVEFLNRQQGNPSLKADVLLSTLRDGESFRQVVRISPSDAIDDTYFIRDVTTPWQWQGDAIRNIEAAWYGYSTNGGRFQPASDVGGAATHGVGSTTSAGRVVSATIGHSKLGCWGFDASLAVPTAVDNRMVNRSVNYIIKVKHSAAFTALINMYKGI